MSKLLRQLRREATRNPKKAGILGILALVAVWFWAPLVMNWVRGDGPKASAASKNSGSPAADSAAGGAATPKDPQKPDAKQPALDWQQIVRLTANDPKSQPAQAPPASRDPFVTPKSQLFPPLPMVVKDKEPKPPEKKPEPVVPDVSPKELGLSLSSTIVGPRGGLATINGKAYKPNDTVVVRRESKSVEFQLTEVHPRRVVLVRNGKSYSLEIPRPNGTGQVGLVGGQ